MIEDTLKLIEGRITLKQFDHEKLIRESEDAMLKAVVISSEIITLNDIKESLLSEMKEEGE